MKTPDEVCTIVNPFAARGKSLRIWPKYRSALEARGVKITERLSQAPGHATLLAQEAIRNGAVTIIAVGGDGTVNEIVNGFADKNAAISENASLAIVPAGTGKDLVRTLHVPALPEQFAESILRRQTRRIDIGRIHYHKLDGTQASRYFVNIADFGFGGLIAKNINGFPRVLGNFVAYISALIVALFSHRSPEVVFQIDDKPEISGRHFAVLAANGQYFGGGMWIAPEARLDDGAFEIALVGDVGKMEVVRNLPKLYNGKLHQHPKVTYLQGKKLTARSNETVYIDMDGEMPGKLPATFEIVPQAIRVHI